MSHASNAWYAGYAYLNSFQGISSPLSVPWELGLNKFGIYHLLFIPKLSHNPSLFLVFSWVGILTEASSSWWRSQVITLQSPHSFRLCEVKPASLIPHSLPLTLYFLNYVVSVRSPLWAPVSVYRFSKPLAKWWSKANRHLQETVNKKNKKFLEEHFFLLRVNSSPPLPSPYLLTLI